MRGAWLGLAIVSGCARDAYVRPGPPVVVVSAGDAVPVGTLAAAQLAQPLSTARSRGGDRFTLELLDPLVDASGREVVTRGAVVEGLVRRASASQLELSVAGVRVDGGLRPLSAEVASAPFETDGTWSTGVLGGAVGAAAGSGVGLAIDADRTGVVLGSAIVGIGVGVLAGVLFGHREGELGAGSIVTLRLTRDTRIEPVAPSETP